ncbi:MAG: prolipoprotein diacylglyceryl transferase [Planctomycetota bacterium]
MLLAEIPYPRIHPDLLHLGPVTVRWYGVSYILAFVLAWWVLRGLAKQRRWPVEPDRVADVLFWGILGVFVGGRLGWVLFYGFPQGSIHGFWQVFKVWEGGMSFHGGLLGVVIAYAIYIRVTKVPKGPFLDGLALATPLGIFCVRMANFVNAELPGRVWDGPWAMRFPRYGDAGGVDAWEAKLRAGQTSGLFTELRHPSQLYEGVAEGLILFFFLRWLMLRKNVGGGRIAATFLVGYGLIRFLLEFLREPDAEMGYVLFGVFTQGQILSAFMIGAGIVTFAVCAAKARKQAVSA